MRDILDFGFWILDWAPAPDKGRQRVVSFAIFLSAVFTIAAWGNCPMAPEPFDANASPLMSGNGRLTVGVDVSGRISVCRWPRPSDSNQVSASAPTGTSDDSGYALAWGVRLSEETLWLGDAPWEVKQHYVGDALARIETRFELPSAEGKPIVASQSVFVCPERDVFVVRLVLRGGAAQPVYWLANFSPCTRQVPEWPGANDVFATSNDFAAYTPDQGKTMAHFRPQNPDAEAWSKAERLVPQPAEDTAQEWPTFGEGVWIAYGSPNEIVGFQCGEEGTVTSAFEQAKAGNLEGSAAAVGLCDSALSLRSAAAGSVASVTVMAALGENVGAATESLYTALRQGYDALVQETDAYWNKRLSGALLPKVKDDPLLLACKRDLVTLLQCTDPRSGAMVRSPVGDSLLALDWVHDGAWTTLALDKAGYQDAAGQHTLFYAGAFRKQEKRGKPYGSIPAGLYANGVEGVPHLILDVDAVAWTLGSFWRHATFLAGDARQAYLAELWSKLVGAADFLAGWTDGRTRQPLYAFDYDMCRDGPSQDRLLTTYMGMDAALRIAQALGISPTGGPGSGRGAPLAAPGQGSGAPLEEWTRRKRDLDALIRFHCVDKAGQWKSDAILPYWQPEIAETELPSWAGSAERRFSEAERSGSPDVATLCETALVWQGQPERLARLKPHLGKLGIPAPDALAAAQHFITASIIYAPPKMP